MRAREAPAGREMTRPPQAIILAGPNGAGKSTTAIEFVPDDIAFVNADLIAQAISGEPGTAGDINAGRVLLDQVQSLVHDRVDFALETTLSARSLVRRIRGWQASGYEVSLIFVWLPSQDLAVERVAARIRAGGHRVPEDTICRRYDAGIRNLFRYYLPIVDSWRIVDNSRPKGERGIAEYNRASGLTVWDEDKWAELNSRRHR